MKRTRVTKVLSCIMAVILLVMSADVTVFAADNSDAELQGYTELSSSASTRTLTEGKYKVTSGDVTFSKGLVIADGATVYIHVASGLTLTATGVNGSGSTGGTAGIRLPESSTLYLVGDGNVVARGGNAGNGSAGSVGGSSSGIANGSQSGNTAKFTAGNGGAGGAGGGGAGAGIGTDGGNGGAGGTGGQGAVIQDFTCMGALDGSAGTAGSSGSEAAQMGTLYAAPGITITSTGGSAGTAGGTAGAVGTSSSLIQLNLDTYTGNQGVAGAAGGGGGGAGYAGANIGTGGYGGAGGGGGGSAGFVWMNVFIPAGGGGGGNGAVNGSAGISGTKIAGNISAAGFGATVSNSSSSGTYLAYCYNGNTSGYYMNQHFGPGTSATQSTGTNGGKGLQGGYMCDANNKNDKKSANGGDGGDGGAAGAAGTEKGALPTEIIVKFVNAADESEEVADSQTIELGGKPSRPDNDPVKSNFIFEGWYEDAACTKEFDFESSISSGSVKVYAKFTGKTYGITLSSDADKDYEGTTTLYEKYNTGFYLNEGTTREMTPGKNKIVIPKKTGYGFLGYYTEEAGAGTQVIKADGYLNDSQAYTYAEGTVLYAYWQKLNINYTIEYKANGGTVNSGAVTTQERKYTAEADSFTLKPVSGMFTGPVSSAGGNYEFVGWSTSPSAIEAEYTDGASIADLTNVDGAVIYLYAVWKSPLPSSIQNGSFENPVIAPWTNIMRASDAIYWKTTAGDQCIEFGRPSRNVSASRNAYHTTSVVDGYQFAELCANQVGALYQTVSTVPGNTLHWGFSHKGRNGNDTMELWIGTHQEVTAVLDYYRTHNNSVSGITGDLLDTYNKVSVDGSRRYTDGNDIWKSYTGTYTVPDGQTETTFAFVSTATHGNNISCGNLLDNVYFTAEMPPRTQVFEYGSTAGGKTLARINGISTSGGSALVSTGSTIEFQPQADTGYTYNGGYVDEEYISADDLELSNKVTDAGNSIKRITLLFSKDSTITFDAEGGSYAREEYDLKAAGNDSRYTIEADPVKTGYAFTNWQIAGSTVTLSAGNYIEYETDADANTFIRVYDNADKTNLLYTCDSADGIILIAKYTWVDYPSAVIELDADGGIVGNVAKATYYLDAADKTLILPDASRTASNGIAYIFKGWQINGNTYPVGTEITWALNEEAENGQLTIGGDVQTAITTDTTYTLTALWEGNDMEGVSAGDVTKTYDGAPSDAITVNGTPSGATITYGTSRDNCVDAACPVYTEAGEYTVYYKVTAEGYKDYIGSAVITVKPRPVIISWSGETSYIYDGNEHSVTAEVANGIGSDSFTISYEFNKGTAAGSYTAKVTDVGNDNYTVTDGENITNEWKITYLESVVGIVVTGDKIIDTSDWYTDTVTISPDDADYTILRLGDDSWKSELTVTENGVNTITYQLKNSQGFITEPRTEIIKIDTTLPGGEIQVGSDNSNRWNTLLNSITFGRFFRKTQKVTISGTDADGESGIDKVYYYLSATGLTVNEVKALTDSDWTKLSDNGFLSIDPDKKLIIYAKITDRAGHVSYVSSDGLVLDATAPKITGIADGEAYCEDMTFTVTDEYLKEVTLDGAVITLTGGSYTLTVKAGQQTIVATDEAGNETIVRVTISDGHVWNEPLFNWNESGDACLAVRICKNNSSHKESQSCTVTGELTKAATGTEQGEITYTAKVTFDGIEYTDTNVVKTGIIETAHVGNGTITTEVTVADDAPTSIISGLTIEAAKDMLTDEELDEVRNGKDVLIYLEMTNIDDTVSETDRKEATGQLDTIVNQIIESDAALTSKKEVDTGIRFVDLSLFKKVGTANPDKLYETGDNKIKIIVEVPEDMRSDNDKRVYSIIRVHYAKGSTTPETEIIPAVYDAVNYTLTFETNKFSTYAIAYAEPNGIVAVTNVTLDSSEATLTKKGDTIQLTPTVTPDNATNKKVIWTTSDVKVATVDENGKVTAVGNGTCTITATTEDEGKTSSCVITVSIPEDNGNDQPGGGNTGGSDNDKNPAEDIINEIIESPRTGLRSSGMLGILLISIYVLCIAGLGIYRRKERDVKTK